MTPAIVVRGVFLRKGTVKKDINLLRGCGITGIFVAVTLALTPAENQVRAAVQFGQATPVSLTSSSWNADVVYAAMSPNDTATAFDGTYAWYASYAEYNDSTVQGGLPSSWQDPAVAYEFMSASAGTLDVNYTEFEFQSFLGNNCNLFSGMGSKATLTLTNPTAYDNLALLGASANAAGDVATVSMVLNFANGSSSMPITYNVYDWSKSVGPSSQGAIAGGVDRSIATTGTETEATTFKPADGGTGYFQMYETDFDLSSTYANELITSISFSATSGGDIGIFALSGYANPNQPVYVPPSSPPQNDPPSVSAPATFSLTTLGAIFLGLKLALRRQRRGLWHPSHKFR